MALKLEGSVVNMLFPVTGVIVYKGSLDIVRSAVVEFPKPVSPPKRGVVEGFSNRSLYRFLSLVIPNADKILSLLTLSYGVNYPISGKTVKAHLNRVLMGLRRRFEGLQYFWFLEFQRRGAPHFHIGLSVPMADVGYSGKLWLASLWAAICTEFDCLYSSFYKRGDFSRGNCRVLNTVAAVKEQHLRRGVWEDVRTSDGAARYVAKYASKGRQKDVPRVYRNVGRFWGVSSGFTRGDSIRLSCNESQAREFLAYLGRDLSGFEVLPKVVVFSGVVPGL